MTLIIFQDKVGRRQWCSHIKGIALSYIYVSYICILYFSIRLSYLLVYTSYLDSIKQSILILPSSLKTVANLVSVFSFRQKLAPSKENWADLADPHPHIYSQFTLSSIRSTYLADPHPLSISVYTSQLNWLIESS